MTSDCRPRRSCRRRLARPARLAARRARKSWSDVAFSVWGVLVMLFLFLPIIVIVVYSFNTGRLLVSWDGFGFDAFAHDPRRSPRSRARCGSRCITALHRRDHRDGARHARRHRDGAAPRQVGVVVPGPAAARVGDARDRRRRRAAALDGVPRTGPRASRCSTTASCACRSARRCSRPRWCRTSCAPGSWVRTRTSRRHPPTSTRSRSRRSVASRSRSRCRRCSPGFLLAFTLSLDNTIVAAFVQVSGTTPWPVYVLSALRIGPAPRDRRGVDDHAAAHARRARARRARAQARGRLGDADRPHDDRRLSRTVAARPGRGIRPLTPEVPPCPTPTSSSPAGPSSPPNTVRSRASAVAVDGRAHRRGRRRRRARPRRPDDRGRRPRGDGCCVPGFQDAHVHPVWGGLDMLRCDLAELGTAAEYLEAIGALRRARTPTTSGSSAAAGRCRPSPAARRRRRRSTPSCPTARRSSPTATATARGSTRPRCGAPASTATRPIRPTGASSATPTATRPARCTRARWRLVNRLPARRAARAAHRGAAASGSAYLHSYGITAWQDAIVGVVRRCRRPGPAYLRGRRRRHAHGPRRRRDLVGPHAGPRADPVAPRAARALSRRPLRRDQRQDHAGRRRRELHRLDARAVLRRARSLHRQLGHLVRRRPRS